MQAGNTIYVSGQLGVDAQGKFVSNDVVGQTRQALANMRQVLSMAGADMSRGKGCFDAWYENVINAVVKCIVLMKDLSEFERMNAEYAKGMFNRWHSLTTLRKCCSVWSAKTGAHVLPSGASASRCTCRD